ncbi:uncharacterized [Tachysurus ichikawai]
MPVLNLDWLVKQQGFRPTIPPPSQTIVLGNPQIPHKANIQAQALLPYLRLWCQQPEGGGKVWVQNTAFWAIGLFGMGEGEKEERKHERKKKGRKRDTERGKEKITLGCLF